jgi:hypothetical protein
VGRDRPEVEPPAAEARLVRRIGAEISTVSGNSWAAHRMLARQRMPRSSRLDHRKRRPAYPTSARDHDGLIVADAARLHPQRC